MIVIGGLFLHNFISFFDSNIQKSFNDIFIGTNNQGQFQKMHFYILDDFDWDPASEPYEI